jgi:hypothetical protein
MLERTEIERATHAARFYWRCCQIWRYCATWPTPVAARRGSLITLKTAIAHCDSVQDYISREALVEVLDDTEERIDYLETQIELIGKVGLQSYLLSQMDAPSSWLLVTARPAAGRRLPPMFPATAVQRVFRTPSEQVGGRPGIFLRSPDRAVAQAHSMSTTRRRE